MVFKFFFVNAADGTGTVGVTPNSVQAGTSGNAFSFVFTAGESMPSGEISLAVPAGWSAPQGSVGAAGYTTATSNGILADVEDSMDRISGWATGTACTNGIALGHPDKHEGAGSIACSNGNEANNDRWYKNIAAENWSAYTHVGFWIYSTVSIASGNLRFAFDDNVNLASPIDQLSFGSAVPANTWTYVALPFSGSASSRASVVSYGFVIRNNSALDNSTVRVDDLLLGPGQPTFAAGEIHLRLLSLAAGQTVTIRYGDGGGTNGVTAPSALGTYTFTTKSRTNDAGILTNIGVSPSITVGPGPATQFEIVNPTDGSVDAPITVTVHALDQYGNIDTTYQNDVTLVTDGAATGAGLVNIQNGVGTRTLTDTLPETVLLSLSDTQGTGLTVTSTQDVVFSAGDVARYVLNNPGNGIVGSRIPYTVTRKDRFGNPITSGSSVVYLYSSSTGTGKGFYTMPVDGGVVTSVTIGNGTSTANFWYADELAGSSTITVSDNATSPDGNTGIADGTDDVWLSSGAPAQFQFSGTGAMTAGTRAELVVSRRDAYGNVTTSTNSQVYLYSDSTYTGAHFYATSSGGAGIASVSIPTGASNAVVWYADEKAGSWTVTASDNGVAPDGAAGLNDGALGITVSAAPNARYILNNPGDMTAGSRLGYAVSREDIFGNVVTLGANTVYLYTSSTGMNAAFYSGAIGGSSITSITIPNSQSTANFYYSDDAAGVWKISASDNATGPNGAAGIEDGTDMVTVTALPVIATKFVIDEPADGTVDAPILVTVKAVDDAGDVDTSFQGDVTLVASGSVTGAGRVSIVNGQGGLSLSDANAETVQLQLTDSQSTGLNVSSTKDVVFAPGIVTQFLVTGAATVSAGIRTPLLVTRKDRYGNAVTAPNTTAYLYTTSLGPVAKFYESDTDGVAINSISIPSGTSTKTVWFYDELAGNTTETVSDNAVTPDAGIGVADATLALQVAPAEASRFVLSHPGILVPGGRVGYTVTRQDAFANPVTVSDQTVYLFTNSTGSALFYSASSGGSTMSAVTVPDGQSTKNFWYGDTAVGNWLVTVSDHGGTPDGNTGIDDAVDTVQVQNIPIIATRFVIVDPADAVTGAPIVVTVQAEDNSGNVDSTYQQDVTLVTTGSATGSGLVNIVNGIGSRMISDAVAETVHLSLADTQGTGLNVASVQTVDVSVTPAGPTETVGPQAVATGGPTSGISGMRLPQGFRLSGIAYPGATIRVSAYSVTGEHPVTEFPIRSADGSFATLISGPFPGIQSFAVTVVDPDGRLTPSQYFTWYPQNEVLLEKHIQVPPTMDIVRAGLSRGEDLVVMGYAMPDTAVGLILDGLDVSPVAAAADGSYRVTVSTRALASGSHVVRAKQILNDGSTGGYSLQKSFSILGAGSAQMDLNNDGRVDISDWSIFLTRWNSTDENIRSSLDVNSDGLVNVTDFSIFVRSIHP